MNKKIIVLILVLFCLLSTVLISVLGKVPEDDKYYKVETLEILDVTKPDNKCELNVDGEKIIKLEANDIKTTDSYGKEVWVYQLNYLITPDNATNPEVSFEVLNENLKNDIVISDTGEITFYKEIISVTIKVTSLDQNVSIFDTVIIEFIFDNTEIM